MDVLSGGSVSSDLIVVDPDLPLLFVVVLIGLDDLPLRVGGDKEYHGRFPSSAVKVTVSRIGSRPGSRRVTRDEPPCS